MGMTVFGKQLGPKLIAYAADALVPQVAFEFPVALLAMRASKALAPEDRALPGRPNNKSNDSLNKDVER